MTSTDNTSSTQTPSLPKEQPALISSAGGPGVTAVKTIPLFLDGKSEKGELAEHEILVKIRAVSVNPIDEKYASGAWGEEGKVVGCDASGDVVRVGSAVQHVNVGDRVAAFTMGGVDESNGSYSEYCRFKDSTVLKLPEGMTYEEGATMPVPHWTAVQALYMRLDLPAPSKAGVPGPILIWGGATSVAHHALQLARLSGLSPVVTASTEHTEHLTNLGAVAVVDYKDPEAVDKIKQAAKTDIRFAVDCAVAGDSTLKCVQAVAAGGHVVTLLPVPNEAKDAAVAKGVHIQFTLSGTLIREEFTFGRGDTKLFCPAHPRDYEAALSWAKTEWPALAADWKDGASPKLCAPRIKKMPGGLDRIEEGFNYMREGKVHAEKLVYTVA